MNASTVPKTDIAWLTGMIESEGSIGFQTMIRRKTGKLLIVPFIRFTNSDELVIYEFLRICNELGCSATKYWRVNRFSNKFSNKECCNIRLERMDKVEQALCLISPYMKSIKRTFAESVLKFITSRRKNLLLRNYLGQIVRNGYSEYEIMIVGSVRLHKRAMTVERMLQASNIVKER